MMAASALRLSVSPTRSAHESSGAFTFMMKTGSTSGLANREHARCGGMRRACRPLVSDTRHGLCVCLSSSRAKSSSRANPKVSHLHESIIAAGRARSDEHVCMWAAAHRCACAGRVCSGIFRACASRFPYSRWQSCTLWRPCLFSEKPQTSTRSAFHACYGGDGEKFCAQTLRRGRRRGEHGGRKLLLCGRDTREASRRQSGTRRDGESESENENESERASEIESPITFTFFCARVRDGQTRVFVMHWLVRTNAISFMWFRVY
jgi:hypothetical protein